MDIENKKNIEELLKTLRTDKNAPSKLLKIYAGQMYSEAKLYISDKEEAKNTCSQAFAHTYGALSNAEAEDVEGILKKAVQDECIRTTVFNESETDYNPDDEVPDENASFPEDMDKIKSALRRVLDHLTPAQRLIAVLKYRDGLSFSTIADKLNVSEFGIKGILQDAKDTLKKSNVDTGMVFALINKVFPYYEAPAEESEERLTLFEKDLSELKNKELTNDDQFNTTLSELKDFFNTAAISPHTGSMYRRNDDSDEDYSDSDEKTMEMDKIVDDEDYSSESKASSVLKTINDPVVYWGKRVAIILTLMVVGFGISLGVSALRNNKKAEPAVTPEPVETETSDTEENAETEETENTPEPEETPESEETPEPDEGILGSGYINVTDLSIRSGPGITYEQNGISEYAATYDIYEIAQADGYTWYRVGEGQWIPDYEGQYVIYTPKE